MKKCPFCAEEIQDKATVCRHCNRDLKGEAPKKSTEISKPAGCAMQSMGVVLILVAIGAFGSEHGTLGVFALIAAGALLLIGRRPATHKD